MYKIVKKSVIGLLFASAISTQALTVSITLTNGQFTTFTGLNSGALTLKSFIIGNSNASPATISFYDVTTNVTVFTNAAFTNITSFGTNQTNSFTNYQGIVQYFTNTALVDISNSVTQTIFTNPPRIAVPINGSNTIAPPVVNQYFTSGLWLSNSSASNITVTVTVTQ